MDVITRWVTQIIVFLLIAMIIDLLIPATALKKYVKLVIGLILMLIFLKPIFFLFTMDFQTDLASSLEGIYQEEMSIEMMEDLTNMQKTDIESAQAAYILEEMVFQLKDLAKDPLLENYGIEITNIDFAFSHGQEMSFEGLEEITVYLHESNGSEEIVNRIDEIRIQTDDRAEDVENDQEEDIKLLLQEIWEFRNKDLTIKWEGGTS